MHVSSLTYSPYRFARTVNVEGRDVASSRRAAFPDDELDARKRAEEERVAKWKV